MINLLPPQEKAKLLSEKRKKIIIVLGTIIIIPMLCFILIMVSIIFYLFQEVDSQKIILQEAKNQYQTSDFLHFKDIIQKSNAALTKIEPFYKKELYLTHILKTLSGLDRPEKLYLTDLSLVRTKEQKIKVTISGFAKTREDLLLFQKTINENPSIENSTFSPDSWVAAQNVKFTIVFEVTKN